MDYGIGCFRAGILSSRTDIAAENLALRQQLAIYLLEKPQPKLTDRDRSFWVRFSRWFSG